MSNPIIAKAHPAKVELTKGDEYYFCACGRSANQPFCDGSYAGTDFKLQSFIAEESGDAYKVLQSRATPQNSPCLSTEDQLWTCNSSNSKSLDFLI